MLNIELNSGHLSQRFTLHTAVYFMVWIDLSHTVSLWPFLLDLNDLAVLRNNTKNKRLSTSEIYMDMAYEISS